MLQMATRMGSNKVLPLCPLTATPRHSCRALPPFIGNGDPKIWLRLVDYFEENAIPEEKPYSCTKSWLSDEVYGMVTAAGFDTKVVAKNNKYKKVYLSKNPTLKQKTEIN
ncbi:hypothetical protein T09_10915 [Trichinella sp. T9]|nr:hypothetical protein T09_10915 [Trichinella sp. T9]